MKIGIIRCMQTEEAVEASVGADVVIFDHTH